MAEFRALTTLSLNDRNQSGPALQASFDSTPHLQNALIFAVCTET